MKAWMVAGCGLAAFAGASAREARADGYPPFFGYSGYFGGPAVYYTPDPDVQQTTRMRDGSQGFGVRTYTTGGPFYGYKPARVGRAYETRRRVRAIRVKG